MKILFLLSFLLVFDWHVHAWITTISLQDDSTLKLLVGFKNDFSDKAYLLKWRTPFDELEGLYSFVVTKDGQKIEYKGPIALRLDPQYYDYVVFNANQTLTTTVDLAKAFDFPVVGLYQVQMVVRVLDSDSILTSNAIDIPITTPSIIEMVVAPMSSKILFRNCNTAQQNILNPAWIEFGVASNLMLTNVVLNPEQSALYKTWFGVYDSNRFNLVRNCIYRLDADFKANGKEFYCNPSGCSPGVVAYVTSGAPNTIHVCQLYFELSNRDHIFVIVHEEMHFGAICGAPDYVYGRQGSMNLAITNPNNAIRNSDNYRFYGEDLYYGSMNGKIAE